MQDETYRQIFFHETSLFKTNVFTFQIKFSNQFYLILFVSFILISHSNALPVTTNSPFRIDLLRSTYKIYRHSTPNSIQMINRERYRRKMIERLFSTFDEDVDGQLSKDELYSLSLRLNIFPKYHHYLKNSN